MTIETSAVETPARAATSASVGRRSGLVEVTRGA
jgi:hypothetical protein